MEHMGKTGVVTKAAVVATTMAILAAGLIVGCGGDDSAPSGGDAQSGSQAAAPESSSGSESEAAEGSGSGSGKTIPKQRFLRKGNAVCEKTVQRITSESFPKIEETFDGDPGERASVEATLAETVMAPELRDEVAKLREIGVPPGDGQRVNAILAATEAIADEMEERPGDVIKRPDVFAKPSRLADQYGLAECPYG